MKKIEIGEQLHEIFALNMVCILNKVSRKIGTVGELGPLIQRIGTPLFSSKVVLFARQSGSNCPNSVGQLEPPCRAIGTTLSDNWNHLVGQLEPPCQTIGTTLSYK